MSRAPKSPAAAVADRLGRPLGALRVSVTDRCNLRCTYCMPREVFGPGFEFLPRSELLTFEEITRVVAAFGRCGVTAVRLTGGEPLLRRDVSDLVGMLAALDVIDEVAMTTNATLLARHAADLRAAGLARVTVSLDALDDVVFRRMSDVDLPVTSVLDGIAAAAAAGFSPIKVNAVVRRGINDHEVEALAAYGRDHGHTVRFIEYMDVGHSNGWRMDEVVPAAEILDRLAARWPLEPSGADGAVAERYRYLDGAGEVGVIASVTRPFCRTCVRARLSALGEVYTCLFATRGHDLRDLVRRGADVEELAGAIEQLWGRRTDRYSEIRTAGGAPNPERVEMSYIGG